MQSVLNMHYSETSLLLYLSLVSLQYEALTADKTAIYKLHCTYPKLLSTPYRRVSTHYELARVYPKQLYILKSTW